MVSPAKLGETCGSCHPGAGTRFAMGAVHVAATDTSQPVLYWARWIYLSLIAGTIGFMALHNGLDFARKIGGSLGMHLGKAGSHAESHAAAAGRWFVRMTLSERVQHFLLATSFFTLVYTGFALKYPEAWLFTWLARLEGGYAWRSWIHRGAALVMVAVSLAHVAYLLTPRGRQLVRDLFPRLEGGYAWRSWIHRGAALVMVAVSLAHVAYLLTPRGRQLVRDLFPRLEDARDLAFHTLYLLGLRKAPARFDRFGYIEKAEYWALIWGTVVMTVTGFLLWFENPALERLPKWVLDLSTVVHYYEAWLAFLAIVVWHLYQNIVNPDVYPMNWTWYTGRIPEAQMRHEHPLEWERLTRAEAAEEDADDAVEPPSGAPGSETGPPADGSAPASAG
jgi:cytochrome b subunit of formate dehydrogenase